MAIRVEAQGQRLFFSLRCCHVAHEHAQCELHCYSGDVLLHDGHHE